MSTFSKIQQIHSLSFAANSAFGLSWEQQDGKGGVAKMQTYVQSIAAKVLQDTTALIGDYKAVWGPIVYANDPTATKVHADNTMGLYYSASEKLFVVAIAGTNINSPFGWMVEDFTVNEIVKWETITGEKNSGGIAKGTSIGLDILVNKMKDASGKTMIDALKGCLATNTIETGTEVAVSGHSLGGALSPVVAMYLLNTKKNWDPNNKVSIGAYPTAGPTPGDEKFVAFYEKQIKDHKITYNSMFNELDIVPHAWQATDLEQIPSIYDNYIKNPSGSNPVNTVTGTLAVGAALNALAVKVFKTPYKNPYQQIAPFNPLKGTFNTEVDNTIYNKLKFIGLVLPKKLKEYAPYFTNLVRFAAQAGYQHTTAYDGLLNIEKFTAIYKEILKANVPTNNQFAEPYELAIEDIANLNINDLDENEFIKIGKQSEPVGY